MVQFRWHGSHRSVADDLPTSLISTKRKTFHHGCEWARSLCFAGSTDEILVVATGDDRVLVFNVETGTLRGELNGHTGPVHRMKCYRDDVIVAIAGEELIIWKVYECKILNSIRPGASLLTAMIITDKNYIVVGDIDEQLRVFAISENNYTVKKINAAQSTHNALPKDDTLSSLMMKQLGLKKDPSDYTPLHERRIWDIASHSNELVTVGEDSRAVQWLIAPIGEGSGGAFNLRRVSEWKQKGPITCAAMNANIIVTCGLDEIRICARNAYSFHGANVSVLRGAKHGWIRGALLSGKHLITRLSGVFRGSGSTEVLGAHKESWIHRALLVDRYLLTAGGDGCVSLFRESDLPGPPFARIDIKNFTSKKPLGMSVWDMALQGSNSRVAVCGQWYSGAHVIDLPSLRGERSSVKAFSNKDSKTIS